MRRIRVRRTLDAPVEDVWDALADIEAHVEWMADARAIRFTSPTEEGVGTTFDCDTKVGPLRLTDHMEITEWEPGQSFAVRHIGIVTGEGVFTVEPRGEAKTALTWEETLHFPWWIPAAPAATALALIWRGNLRRLERVLREPATARRGARRRDRRRRRAG